MVTIEKLVLLPLVIFALLFVPDITVYTSLVIKNYQLTDYATEQIAAAGGWDDQVAAKVQGKMQELKLDPAQYTISHTDGKVTAPDIVFFRAQRKYRISAFDVLGSKMVESMEDRLVLTIDNSKTAASQIY